MEPSALGSAIASVQETDPILLRSGSKSLELENNSPFKPMESKISIKICSRMAIIGQSYHYYVLFLGYCKVFLLAHIEESVFYDSFKQNLFLISLLNSSLLVNSFLINSPQ
jgi:hypothetical protein